MYLGKAGSLFNSFTAQDLAQHFLLSKGRRTLDMASIERMSEEEAFSEICRMRWGNGNEQKCPRCGVIKKHYFIQGRKQWRCKDCGTTFSVTTATIFSSHKLPFRKLLRTLAELAKRPKGISAVELAATLGCQYKSAWVLLQKIRESLWVRRDTTPLEGTVHADGAYVCHHVRPKNHRVNRVDRRLKHNQNPNKRCILTMRQLASEEEREMGLRGAVRSIISIVYSETQEDILLLSRRYIKPGAMICADENPAYDPLHAYFNVKRVNHQTEYSTKDGISNNQAESFHARLRGMLKGVVHHFWPKHAFLYANQVAYLEDTRRWDTKRIYEDLINKCLCSAPSPDFRGYWQGNKRQGEQLAV